MRVDVRDCTSGYRCWRRATLAALPLDDIRSDGYSFLIETLYMAVRRGARIAEVPITFVERRIGESKLSGAIILESVMTPWRLIARPGPR
jgi:dolichol-phosphate mannosyltransferase